MIEVKTIADSLIVLVDTVDSVQRFQELVQRGANLWPDAHPEIKEFADVITNKDVLGIGENKLNSTAKTDKGLQDYWQQDTSKGKQS